jgi:HEAT repeat protein
MPRSQSVILAAMIALLSHANGARADEPVPASRGPILPLAEYASRLKDPDRQKRLAAAEAIRDHYKGKSLKVLPQILTALGEVLDQLRDEPTAEQSVLNHTEAALRQAAYEASAGRLKVIRESTRHPDPRVRAAAFRAWLKPVNREANMAEDRGDLLAAIRRGLKDDSPLVRAQAAYALAGLWDAPPEMVGEAVSLLAATLEDREKPHDGADSPAFEAAGMLSWFGAKAKPAVPALGKAATAGDARLAWMSITALHAIAKADESVAEEVVRVFRSTFTDKRRPESVRVDAIRKLIGIGPVARWAAPDLADLLDDPKTSPRLQSAAVAAFGSMGPRTAPAVPALVRALERSAARWEQLRAVSAHRAVGSAALWLDGWDRWVAEVERQRRSGFTPERAFLLPFDRWMTMEVVDEQIRILGAIKAVGLAATPAVEPLKRYLDRVRGHYGLEETVYEALTAIEK